jgi:hypothetical protein
MEALIVPWASPAEVGDLSSQGNMLDEDEIDYIQRAIKCQTGIRQGNFE